MDAVLALVAVLAFVAGFYVGGGLVLHTMGGGERDSSSSPSDPPPDQG